MFDLAQPKDTSNTNNDHFVPNFSKIVKYFIMLLTPLSREHENLVLNPGSR